MKFTISDTNIRYVENRIKSFRKSLYFGPLLVVILTTLLLYRISLENTSTLVLFIMGFVLLIPPLALVVIAPSRAILRYQKIVKEVLVIGEEIHIIHIDNTSLMLKEFKLIFTEFNLGSKLCKATLINYLADETSSVLLHKFFAEYEQIINCLEAKKT